MTAWRLSVLLNCVVLVSCSADATEQQYLEDALRALHMTAHDLSFKKDHVESEFVLRDARGLLHRPNALPALADDSLVTARGATNLVLASSVGVPFQARSARALRPDRLRPEEIIDLIVTAANRARRRLPKPHRPAWDAFALDEMDETDIDPELRRRHENLELQDDEIANRILTGANRFDRETLQQTFAILLAAVDEALTVLPGSALGEQTFETDLGKIIVGGHGPDTYRDEAFLIIDLGGDDRYENSAGGANGLLNRPVSIVIDLAGNDQYLSRRSFSQGSGVFGIGILVDCAGDDVYEAKHLSQGAGFFGCGLLADFGGKDRFVAETHAQGAATFGAGVLWQRGGHTKYQVASLGQGYGGTMGHGLLLDGDGDDEYVARGDEDCGWLPGHKFTLSQGFGYGMRPFAGGGIGILCDLKGNDRYQADVYGQGASYWYAVGMLLDAEGDDRYEAHQYGQGAGIHLSSGALVDGAGNDTYTAHAICQGAAHDYAVGMLIDRGGNDEYTGNTTAQGSAINNSFALLLDRGGDDSYTGTDPKQSQAAGHDGGKREYGSIAVMLDLGGGDSYSQGQTNGMVWLKPHYGAGVDVEAVWSAPTRRRFSASPRRQSGDKSPHSRYRQVDVHHPIERLIRWAISDRDDAEEAWQELRHLGTQALPYWLSRVDSPNVSVRAKAEELIDHLGTNAVPALIAGIRHAPTDDAARLCCYFLARFDENARTAIPVVLPLLRREKTQATALYTLGHLRARQACGSAIRFLRDEREVVRLRAAQALGKIGDKRAIPKLRPLLKDELWTVRFAAAEALAKLGDESGAGVIPPVAPPPAWPR